MLFFHSTKYSTSRSVTHSLVILSVIHSFARSFIPSFAYSPTHSFIHSFAQSFVHSCFHGSDFVAFHWHLNHHLRFDGFTSQPDSFITSASQRHSYRPLLSYSYGPVLKASRTLWECTFLLFFKTVMTLKRKLQMKLCSCLLERMYCLKKCPGVHSTLEKCNYIVPSKHNFCRIC